MAKRIRSYKQFVKKLERAVKRHGEALVMFEDYNGYLRRRKIRKNGKCFVSYKLHEDVGWSQYGQCCFNLGYKRDVTEAIDQMGYHDEEEQIIPLYMFTGKKKKRKTEL